MIEWIDNMFFSEKMIGIQRMTVILKSHYISGICIITRCEKVMFIYRALGESQRGSPSYIVRFP